MKEFVLIEFLAETGNDAETLRAKLRLLGDDFQFLRNEYEYEGDSENGLVGAWIRVSGRINAMYASIIKLQDPFLAERMRISYIHDDLKNKYRK